MGKYFLAMAILICASLPAWADSGRGLLAYQRGDFTSALHIWRPLAARGDAPAQLGMGVLYYNGQGVAVDLGLAAEWFRRAAEQGEADAQYNLGLMHAYGLGVERDQAAARKWIASAAALGQAEAQRWLDGPGVFAASGQQDTPQMLRRYDMALKAFDAEDYETALANWKQLAALGMARAQNSLGVMYDQGLGVAEDQARAAKLFRDAAAQGFGGGQVNLGVMYLSGRGVARDHGAALHWLTRAAKQGFVDAQYRVGLLHATGEQIKPNYVEAAKWYRKAADQGHVKAQYNLAVLLDTGQGVRKDQRAAAEWYRKAALKRIADAQYNIGAMHLTGEGVKKDPAQAHAWFSLASYLGNTAVRNRAIAMRADVEKGLSPNDLTRGRVLAYRWFATGSGGASSKVGRALVLSMQVALASEGLDPGPIDGVMGPRTRAAAKTFMGD